MITKTNFKNLLESLSFKTEDEILFKKIGESLIKADFANEKLIYPKEIKIKGEFTTNFSSNENFVVFECVHRLLELGYKPSQLTLEPKWKLGHGASGGRADIVIKNNEGKVFAIIECKTTGKEFDDAWSAGLQYPSQLFSYAQQEGSTEVICLYTSNFEDNRFERFYYAIPLVDNENLLHTLETVRPYLKGFAYVNEAIDDVVYSTGFAILHSSDESKLLNKLIYYQFMYSKELMNQMISAMPKGSYPSINTNDFENFSITIPSLQTQQQIVQQIELFEAQIASAKITIENAPAQKQAVLKKWLE